MTILVTSLIDALQNGRYPIVTFARDIKNWDIYAQPLMRARAIAGVVHPILEGDDSEMVEITFDFNEFLESNAPLESKGYPDHKGGYTLTAKEAGVYQPIESIYFYINSKSSDVFQALEE